MTQSQQQALLSLLQDGDPNTVDLLKKELIDHGSNRLEEYENLLTGCGELASSHLRDVVDRIRSARNLGEISRQLADLECFEQVETLCWELTRAEHPGLDHGPYARQLDAWAESVKKLLIPNAKPVEQVRALVRVLAEEQNLTGNQTDYYHPRNCYLPWVIEFRQGLPLTLSLIYALVGQRAGIRVDGISAPGHFMARIGDVYFDPYYNGRIIKEDEWEHICLEVSEAHRPRLEQPCSPVQVVHRMLINLRNSYLKRHDDQRQQRIDHYLAVLQH